MNKVRESQTGAHGSPEALVFFLELFIFICEVIK